MSRDNLPSHYVVKDYCPLVFRNLREKFGISDGQYLDSLTKHQPTAWEAAGRSGAKFYQSFDRRFVIKTLMKEEVAQMHNLIKNYHPYVVECHGQTLLPQYLGMYRITVEGNVAYVVVMRNIFGSSLTIHKKYDLKGSTVDRDASDKEREMIPPTLKDNDFTKEGVKIHIGPQARDQILVTLKSDIAVSASTTGFQSFTQKPSLLRYYPDSLHTVRI
ncbi:hypothetical protein LAZ67_2001308 [Cordylochernes scorpioides]|uniref:PIPK domain-containing protein n=1 Tax=Cordylochernes scorpioides TaxID=51811 RepID=A0ABY6K5U0_9ARAC|nr:hypothetical protein LAZ67_2001308 [Cordylochernes scorpioides]